MAPVPVIDRILSPQAATRAIASLIFTLGLYSHMEYYRDYAESADWRNQGDTAEIYDFIVVGGGSAGAAVANRLSKHNRVLLLEIGGNPHPLSILGPGGPGLIGVQGSDLMYETVPQNNSALSLKNRSVRWARGMGLGGSSNLGSLMFQRGNSRDYDNWANITENPEWSYAHLLHFFKKMEDYNGEYPNEKYHGKGGSMQVERVRHFPMADVFLDAAKEKGYPIGDTSSDEPQGFSQLETNSKLGLRWSTYTGYIKPILSRKNLSIYRHSRVVKVHLDKRRRAYGVTYIRFGVSRFVRCKKEIILSAGAIDSPKLLMLSGIGPKKHLHSVGLKCRVNLPVGQNLQDHLCTPQIFLVNSSESILPSRINMGRTLRDLMVDRKGLLLSNGISAVGFVGTSDPAWPDIQYTFTAAGISSLVSHGGATMFGIPIEVMYEYVSLYFGYGGNQIVQALVRPESRGEVKLASKDPFVKPIIQPNYYSHPNDVKAMVEGTKMLVDLMENTKSYKAINGQLLPVALRACEHLKFRSDAYYECYVRHFTITMFHPVGTAAMGKNLNDSRAVVDSELRVFKTKGLRVIDSSIMPVIVNANTNAPAIMIGELGSFFIRRYWARQYEICPKEMKWFKIYSRSDVDVDQKCYYSRLT